MHIVMDKKNASIGGGIKVIEIVRSEIVFQGVDHSVLVAIVT